MAHNKKAKAGIMVPMVEEESGGGQISLMIIHQGEFANATPQFGTFE